MGNLLVVISRLKEVPNPSLVRNLVANTDTGEAEKLRSTAQIRAQIATNAFRQISKGTRPHQLGSQYKHGAGKKQNGQSGYKTAFEKFFCLLLAAIDVSDRPASDSHAGVAIAPARQKR